MTIIKTIVFLLCSTLGWCQTPTVESLFKERSFDTVVSILTKKQKEQELSFDEYFLLSRSYVRTRQFNNGYVLTSEMIAKASKNKDTVNLLKAFNLKTEHILELEKITEGVKFCDSVSPFYRTRDSLEFMSICFKCGLLYHYNSQHQKAYDTYQKITKKEYRNLSIFTNNIAIILRKLGKYDEALIYLKKALESQKKFESQKFGNGVAVEYLNISEIYFSKGNWELSEKYLDSSYNSLGNTYRLSIKKKIFLDYYELYGTKGDFNKAARYLDSIFVINKEILEKRIEEKIHSIEAANNKESVLIKRTILVDDELEGSKNQILIGALILLSIIFVLIISIFILKYRHIQSHYKNILTEQQLNWVRLNPEYLSNSLHTMQGMINDQHPKTIMYLSKFSKLLRLILEGSRKSLIPLKEEIKGIKYYLEILQLETKNNFNFKIQIDPRLEEQEISIPHMLIQPFVSEAVKKGQIQCVLNQTIDIIITYNDDILACEIVDKGKKKIFEKEPICIIKTDVLPKTKELLKIFTKKLNIPSDVTLKGIKTDNIAGTKVTMILPYKNEIL